MAEKRYRLKALSVSGETGVLRKEDDKLYKPQEIGTQTTIKNLLERGMIEEVDQKGEKASGQKKQEASILEEKKAKDDVSVKQLKEALDEKGIEYDSQEKKDSLYERYANLF